MRNSGLFSKFPLHCRWLPLQLPPVAKLARPGLLAGNLGSETKNGETTGSDELEG
ncbi:hypothetical protein SLEP1_g42454 [Rubroshorea leprosula]|uniref:Uncharacterized protein n=1 Tax=Rubroshorea leprosula TaxID=152421 RepID=A0AAV5LAS6_9ROSI|nr:hypothetical protein SLEP1_g42454 [Rubroshorea leprosula]